MLRRDAIALLVAAAAPAPRRAVILLDVRTRRVLTAQNTELIAPPTAELTVGWQRICTQSVEGEMKCSA